jgi:zinc protease
MSFSAPDRTAPPAPGRLRPFDPPTVEREPLGNGLDLVLVPRRGVPLVTVMLLLDSGEAAVDGAEAGLALLTGTALDGGTLQRSGAALAEALEGIGTSLSVSPGWDATGASLTCPADRLPGALALLAEVIRRPGFPLDEVERVREGRLAAIAQRRADPRGLADDEAARLLHAEGFSYGRPLGGTKETVLALTRDRLAEFAARAYAPRDAALIVVGDVEPSEVRTLSVRHFGDWIGDGVVGADLLVAPPRFTDRRILVVDRPGAVQSELRIGHTGVPRSVPGYEALVILNAILGGSFVSRLNMNLRERNGFTYGVRSGFAFRRGAGPFTIGTAVGTEQTAAAVRETMAEVEGLLAEGPTEEEVAMARDYLAGVYPLRFESTAQVASRVAELVTYRLPGDHMSMYRERIRAVTRQEAWDAGRRHVRPDDFTLVVVGDASTVRGPLEELALGPVEVLS